MSENFELPKQYDFHSAWEKWYPWWEEKGLFHSTPNPHKKPFTIVIPPPNVTGALHMGHALNNTLQDIQIRMKRMQGFEALWVPGTDHAGIATQAMVEKKLREEEGLTRNDIGREAMVKRIWDWKDSFEKRIIGQLKKLSVSCDWDRLRFTLDPVCARAVRNTFFTFFEKGLIYRGKKLVNWDTALQTAVSDDEINNETHDGHFWYLKYPVIDPQEGDLEYVTVATTRPETMLGDTCVACHPEPRKQLDLLENAIREELAAAEAAGRDADKAELEAKLEMLLKRRETHLALLEKLAEMAKAGKKLMLPLANREIPLVTDIWAKPEMGTGCVKITPAHDPNDFEVGKRAMVPFINIMKKDGTLTAEASVYAWDGRKFANVTAEEPALSRTVPEKYVGMKMLEAREAIVADLEAAGILLKVEDHQHEVPVSDRSKTVIEPFLNDQWFVRMADLAQSAMDAVTDGRVQIFPERYAKTYLDWLSEKRDWPIGRQLWWGHRIPIWYVRAVDGSEKMPSEDELKAAFADRSDVKWAWDEEGKEWWICLQDGELAKDALPGWELVQDDDVLDTWFSSALWPHSTLGWPEQTEELKYYYPTSVLITSRDIITLWVARMVLTGLQNCGEIPFPHVYIHPKILDKYGETMSKSKGNGIDPLDVIEKYGADALRLGVAWLATDSQDVRLPVDFECPHCGESVEQTKENRIRPRVKCPKCKEFFSTQWAKKEEDLALKRGTVISERFEMGRNFCNKLWNASRFAMMYLMEDLEEVSRPDYTLEPISDEELFMEDKWILSRLCTMAKMFTEGIEKYDYAACVRTLYDFTWDEFCSNYIEIAKYRLQTPELKPVAKRVIAFVLDALLKLWHPVIPLITEEVWQLMAKVAPKRGLTAEDLAREQPESIMNAPWFVDTANRIDPTIEAQFVVFQDVLKAVREIRARQNVPVKQEVKFAVKCPSEIAALILPMKPYFTSMAQAVLTECCPDAQMPELSSNATGANWELGVDLEGLIDVEAELKKNRTQREKLLGFIAGKEKKLSNEAFTAKAPAKVVDAERASLADLKAQLAAVEEAIARLER
ncbi:MAG: valine--tRNA ligase [Planctomycetaceae bacterium]|nr:valine--tRNA ligase [Planctomycetaceae bacterium]